MKVFVILSLIGMSLGSPVTHTVVQVLSNRTHPLHFNPLIILEDVVAQGVRPSDQLINNTMADIGGQTHRTTHGLQKRDFFRDITGMGERDYSGIGHFTSHDFYDPIHRPIVFLPQSPGQINTRFLVYTRRNRMSAHVMTQGNRQAIGNSYFDGKKVTKFIIHGFLDNQLFGPWMTQMKDQFLNAGDYNVVIVDWSAGDGLPYTQATANARVVGQVVALMIKDLQVVSGLTLSNVHILGHSLGAHIAGYAGERLNGQLGRITGLDPAGPYFEGMPPSAKLDYTDAVFVDAIHTDAKHLIPDMAFGTYETSGHLDFYPNGGHDQPGCDAKRFTSIITEGLIEGTRRLVACNHQRAVDFYSATINSRNPQGVGYQCSDYQSYKSGKCNDCGQYGDKCAVIGEAAILSAKYRNTTRGTRYFLTTTDKSPYFNTGR